MEPNKLEGLRMILERGLNENMLNNYIGRFNYLKTYEQMNKEKEKKLTIVS